MKSLEKNTASEMQGTIVSVSCSFAFSSLSKFFLLSFFILLSLKIIFGYSSWLEIEKKKYETACWIWFILRSQMQKNSWLDLIFSIKRDVFQWRHVGYCYILSNQPSAGLSRRSLKEEKKWCSWKLMQNCTLNSEIAQVVI